MTNIPATREGTGERDCEKRRVDEPAYDPMMESYCVALNAEPDLPSENSVMLAWPLFA